MDALPPTNRTLDKMDAAARDLGIVPGDPAYAFYTGLRRLYAEQQAGVAQAINAIKAAQPKITDEHVKAMGNQLVRSFDSTAKRIASGLTVKAFAVLAAIAVALLAAGVAIGWALFATPGDYTCQSSSDGGTVCFKWVVPRPSRPTPAPAPPEPQQRAPHHQ
jgi:hypothetical protein